MLQSHQTFFFAPFYNVMLAGCHTKQPKTLFFFWIVLPTRNGAAIYNQCVKLTREPSTSKVFIKTGNKCKQAVLIKNKRVVNGKMWSHTKRVQNVYIMAIVIIKFRSLGNENVLQLYCTSLLAEQNLKINLFSTTCHTTVCVYSWVYGSHWATICLQETLNKFFKQEDKKCHHTLPNVTEDIRLQMSQNKTGRSTDPAHDSTTEG